MQAVFARALRVGLLVAVVPLAGQALAEAVAPGVLPAVPGVLPGGPSITDTDIGKEMTVQNWILCTTQANAESIAKARADGVEPALKIYGDLKSTKACGLFPTLKVILRQSLYDSPREVPHATHVYRASVNLGADWPTGFVVSGGLND